MTAEQIAKKVGVSNATVSRVLNNSQYVSPEAREAVLAAIRDTGGVAPKLLGRRSKPVAVGNDYVEVLVYNRFPSNSPNRPSNQGSWPTSRLIEGLCNETRTIGLRSVVQVTTDLRDRALIESINNPANKGLFISGIYTEEVHSLLEKARCPVVSFMTWDHNGWPDYVGIDNLTGIGLGFKHLRELGHSRIGYVAGELRYSHVFHTRLAAYKMNMVDAGLTWRPEWISEGSCELGPMEAGILQMLKSPDRPTAILCAFDGAALAVRRAADKLGLRIPADLSVVGFDDDEIGRLFSPPLTTIRVPVELMGTHAVHLMAMRQQRPIKPGEGVTLRVTPTLIVRESTAGPGSL